jgi:hypothetical protein
MVWYNLKIKSTMKIIFKSILVLFVFSLFACSSDDSNDSKEDDTVTFRGAYELTSLVVETSFDFNNDGIASRNLFEETPCYVGDFIDFRADGFVNIVSALAYISVEVSSPTDYEHVYECLNGFDTISTWTKEGNIITVENGGTDLVGVINGNTLTVTLQDTFEIEMFDGTNYFYPEEDVILEYTRLLEQ